MINSKERKIYYYFFIILIVTGSILAAIAGITANTEYTEYVEQLKKDEELKLTLQTSVLDRNFNTVLSELRFLTHQNELTSYINSNDKEQIPMIAREYLQFSREKEVYDQIRFLDDTGYEIIRINFNNGKPEITDNQLLQNKSDRYYFKDTIKLDPGEVFVSPLDLNIENGGVERPFKPMIRFASPVADSSGKKKGIVVLNYLADRIIDILKQSSYISYGNFMLINSEGYWLYNSDREKEWGFVLPERESRKFPAYYPEEWKQITGKKELQILDNNGLFTVSTFFPLLKNQIKIRKLEESIYNMDFDKTASEYFWKLVSHVPSEVLKTEEKSIFRHYFLLAFIFFLSAAFPSWLIAKRIVNKKIDQLKLFYSANFDKLTGIPNRSYFLNTLKNIIIESERYERKFALLFIDLDGFKAVNDSQGHKAGDSLLIEAAARIKNNIRSSDTTARFGGDEFAVILNSLTTPVTAEIVAKKILETLAEPIDINGRKNYIGASIGISLYPDNGKSSDELIQRADEAMYYVKKTGKHSYRFYV